MAEAPKNILLIKPSALGDIVLALPALTALKKSFPQAKIAWLVRPEYAELLRGHPYLDEIVLFDRRLLGKSWYSPKAFAALKGLFGRLRERRFDLVFDFQGLFRTGFLARVTGCKRRFGMAGARELAYLFYTDKITQERSCIHLVDYYLKMVEVAGAQKGKPEFKLPEDAAANESVTKLLVDNEVDIDNYAVIVPGAARAEKRWRIERFVQLSEAISSQFGYSIVAVGSQGEREYIEAIGKRVINLAGKTTVRELMPLMKGASLVISNDTGPGHIAAALGVPIVMILGPTNPARVCPYNRPECVVAVEPNGRGMKADSYEPRHDISNITVEQVFETVCGQVGRK